MRSDLNQALQQPEDSDRIIYLGDVRRARGRKRSPNLHYLVPTAALAAIAWAAWIVVLIYVPPARLLTYAAFFIPLWLALAATSAMGAYGIEWKRGGFPSPRRCTRRGALIASVITVNLAFQFAHRWSLPVGAVSILLVASIEARYLRKTTRL